MKKALSLTALVAVLAAGCGGAPSGTAASASISSPRPGAELVLGSPVAVAGRVTADGLRNVQVVGDGVVIATVAAQPGSTEVAINEVWSPDSAGSHIIQLKGLNDRSEVIVSTEVIFRLRAPAPTPAPIPTATAQQVIPTAPPPPTPAPTAASTPTARPLPVLTVTNDFANVRAGPNTATAQVARLNKGQTAPVTGKSADGAWWQVQLTGTQSSGWVFGELASVSGDTAAVPVVQATATPAPTAAAAAATPAPTVAAPTAPAPTAPAPTTAAPTATAPAAGAAIVVTNDFVNVRSGPATAYTQLGQLAQNQRAAVRGKSADGRWWQIAFAQGPGGVGWVISDYVRLEGDAAGVPVAPAPPLPTAAPAPNPTPTRAVTTTGRAGGVIASSAALSSADASGPIRTLLALYNEARAEAGLKPLAYSPVLAASAQAHAADLAQTGRGSHTGSDGSTARERIQRVGFSGRYMGENWAWSTSVEQAFDMWFHKEYPDGVHRRSILSPNYTQVGVGIALSKGGMFIIANFGG